MKEEGQEEKNKDDYQSGTNAAYLCPLRIPPPPRVVLCPLPNHIMSFWGNWIYDEMMMTDECAIDRMALIVEGADYSLVLIGID